MSTQLSLFPRRTAFARLKPPSDWFAWKCPHCGHRVGLHNAKTGTCGHDSDSFEGPERCERNCPGWKFNALHKTT